MTRLNASEWSRMEESQETKERKREIERIRVHIEYLYRLCHREFSTRSQFVNAAIRLELNHKRNINDISWCTRICSNAHKPGPPENCLVKSNARWWARIWNVRWQPRVIVASHPSHKCLQQSNYNECPWQLTIKCDVKRRAITPDRHHFDSFWMEFQWIWRVAPRFKWAKREIKS